MSTSLAQAVKDFRSGYDKKADGVSAHHVSWPVDDPRFHVTHGGTVTRGLVKYVSAFVDEKLAEFSRIYSTDAAIRGTSRTALLDYETPEDELVASGSSTHLWLRLNDSASVEEEPDPVDVAQEVAFKEAAKQTRAVGGQVVVLGSEDSVSSEDSECSDDDADSYDAELQGNIIQARRVLNSSVEGLRITEGCNTDARLPLYRPLEEPPHESDKVATKFSFRQNGSLDSAGRSYRDEGEPVSSHVIRDQIGSDRPARTPTISCNPFRTPWPWPPDSRRVHTETSYITDYSIDTHHMIVKARVLTVPSGMTVPMDVWFNSSINASTVQDLVRSTVRANLCVLKYNRSCYDGVISSSEAVAMDTLREMISENQYQRYLKYGFVSVQGRSGDVFLVSRHCHTKVLRGGKIVEEVCLYLKGDVATPPTDGVIARLVMIQADEEAFKKAGNRYKVTNK